MNREVILESDNIYYVNVSYDLIDEYLKLFNNPNIHKCSTDNPKPYTQYMCVKEALETDTLIILSMFDKKVDILLEMLILIT